MHFEWDHDKAERNLAKHAVTFDEAITCFFDPNQVAFLTRITAKASTGSS